ncbi:MAG: response regulator, partial [Deltaproteobacteria bacterium]|nr:response regulator [Deltaproteobacteria bacterium]
IAHDFNNLLMGIQGNVSLMLLDLDPRNPFHDRLKDIEQQVHRGADLTKQLLGFARGGKYEVRPTDLNGLIRDQCEMFGRTRKEITIEQNLEKGLWVVEADQGQMEQVLLNLYVNASQAMPEGGRLLVETENLVLGEERGRVFGLAPGRYVKISVHDTGVGMDRDMLERIFDPFFTTREVGEGTGLGLASAYGIIKNHGGVIDVHSEKGRGSSFIIYLPASESKVVHQDSDQEEKIRTGNETILLVDDEEKVIEVGKEMLSSMGYKVLTARSGREALNIVERAQKGSPNTSLPDLVILDMIMPDMGGGQTFDRLREIDPHIRVLLSSGYSIDGRAQEILNRGCNGFLQKPFNLQELSVKIREVLSGDPPPAQEDEEDRK